MISKKGVDMISKKGFFILSVIGIFLIVLFITSQDKPDICGNAVEYTFNSNKPLAIMFSERPILIEYPAGINKIFMESCTNTKIYCNQTGLIDRKTRVLNQNISPKLDFLVSINNSLAFDCKGNNCLYQNLNLTYISC